MDLQVSTISSSQHGNTETVIHSNGGNHNDSTMVAITN
jgi:hypothetical protein